MLQPAAMHRHQCAHEFRTQLRVISQMPRSTADFRLCFLSAHGAIKKCSKPSPRVPQVIDKLLLYAFTCSTSRCAVADSRSAEGGGEGKCTRCGERRRRKPKLCEGSPRAGARAHMAPAAFNSLLLVRVSTACVLFAKDASHLAPTLL